jgi:hypothetical protein
LFSGSDQHRACQGLPNVLERDVPIAKQQTEQYADTQQREWFRPKDARRPQSNASVMEPSGHLRKVFVQILFGLLKFSFEPMGIFGYAHDSPCGGIVLINWSAIDY